MGKRITIKLLFVMAVIVFTSVVATQVSFSEMTLNDNINVEGDIFLEGDGCGSIFQTAAIKQPGQ